MSKEEIPKPLVRKPRLAKYRGIELNLREGRGFSLGELKEAGISIDEAKKLGIPIDKRRRSIHEWNIKVLKEFIERIRHSRKEEQK